MNRIYIRNLSDDVDSNRLETIFAAVGKVVHVDVQIKNIRGNDYRVAYLEMETAEQVYDSILRFNGLKIGGLALVVGEDKPHVPDPNFRSKSEIANKVLKGKF
jgi:RNA recognition motif-containing protein